MSVSPEWNTHGRCGWCGASCWCSSCHDLAAAAVSRTTDMFRFMHMLLCPDCGNKRCPKATHHDQACTGSNEPGQPGSRY